MNDYCDLDDNLVLLSKLGNTDLLFSINEQNVYFKLTQKHKSLVSFAVYREVGKGTDPDTNEWGPIVEPMFKGSIRTNGQLTIHLAQDEDIPGFFRTSMDDVYILSLALVNAFQRAEEYLPDYSHQTMYETILRLNTPNKEMINESKYA